MTLWAAGAVSAGILLMWHPSPASVVAAPVPPEESRTIPLESCDTTSSGGPCRWLRRTDTEPYGADLQQLDAKPPGGTPNVLLVRGKDIAAAVRAARLGFTGGRADAPIPPDPNVPEDRIAPLWLAAYLGIAGNTSIYWEVHKAEMRGITARLTYSKKRRTGPILPTVFQYLVWVPLGPAKAGTYTLELYDANRKEIMLLRRVVVAEP